MPGQELDRITDVAPKLYLHAESQRPIENIEQIQEDLWTWWAEADLRPSPIRLFVSDGQLNDKYGNDLVAQAQAAAVIRQGRVEQGRVDAEVLGVTRLRDELLSGDSGYGVIYLSPPGTKQEGFGDKDRRRLSFSYLYHNGNAGRIHFLAIPELEVLPQEHFDRVSDLVDVQKSSQIAGGPLDEVSDRSLVAYPFVARDENSLNLLAQKMGYDNLLDLWKKALEAKKLRGRVGELIKHASTRIWDAYQGKENEKLEVLGDVFRGVVALLVSNDLHDINNIHQYFDNKVKAIAGSKQVDRLGGVSSILYEPYAAEIQEFYWRLRNNRQAMGIIEGGSCPGDRDFGFGQNMFGRQGDMMPSNNVLLDALGMGSSLESVSSTTSESSDKGKKECYQCPMSGCGADVYTKDGDTYCLKGHHKGG